MDSSNDYVSERTGLDESVRAGAFPPSQPRDSPTDLLASHLRGIQVRIKPSSVKALRLGRGMPPLTVSISFDVVETERGIALLKNAGALEVADLLRQLLFVMMLDNKQTGFG